MTEHYIIAVKNDQVLYDCHHGHPVLVVPVGYFQKQKGKALDQINFGGAGGLEAQVTIEDQQKWDGKGSPPGAVGKSGTPLPSTLLTDLQTDLTVLCVVYVCMMFVCTVVWVP